MTVALKTHSTTLSLFDWGNLCTSSFGFCFNDTKSRHKLFCYVHIHWYPDTHGFYFHPGVARYFVTFPGARGSGYALPAIHNKVKAIRYFICKVLNYELGLCYFLNFLNSDPSFHFGMVSSNANRFPTRNNALRSSIPPANVHVASIWSDGRW